MGAAADFEKRRCFVCPEGTKVQVFQEAPAHMDSCAQVIITEPSVCADLLQEGRLREEKDALLREVQNLERKGTERIKLYPKKLDILKLWNALRIVQEKQTAHLWQKLYKTMDSETKQLAMHGLTDEAT